MTRTFKYRCHEKLFLNPYKARKTLEKLSFETSSFCVKLLGRKAQKSKSRKVEKWKLAD